MTERILTDKSRTGTRFSPRDGRWTLAWSVPEFADLEALVVGRPVAGRGGRPLPPPAAAILEQVHGTQVAVVHAPGVSPACDASVTTERGLALTVRVADCVPLFLVGPGGHGLAHAGWRGFVGGIVPRTVAALLSLSGDAPESLRAWIGPSIGPCCFEVGPEVARSFSPQHLVAGERFEGGSDRPHVDLWGACHEALVAAGLLADRIETAGVCTRCHQHLLNSYRGSGGLPGRIEAWLRRG